MAKRRSARRNGMKNRCSCKARLEHEQRFLLINLVLTWETVSILDDNTAQRRGYRECHFTHNLAVWQLIASKNTWQGYASRKCRGQKKSLLKRDHDLHVPTAMVELQILHPLYHNPTD